MVFGDRPQQLSRQIPANRVRYITQTKHADKTLLLIQNGQPTDLFLVHQMNCVLNRLVCLAIDDAAGHYFFGACQFRVAPFRDNTQCKITIGNHSDQPILLANRNGTDIVNTR